MATAYEYMGRMLAVPVRLRPVSGDGLVARVVATGRNLQHLLRQEHLPQDIDV